MLKPAEMKTVNKLDSLPRLDGSEATVCHPALTFALWEVHAEAATALRLSQTSHHQYRNCWKVSSMGRRRKKKCDWKMINSGKPQGSANRVLNCEFTVSILLVASLTRRILCSAHRTKSTNYGEMLNSMSSEKKNTI